MTSPGQITGEIIETQFHQRKMADNNGRDAASSGNVNNVFIQLTILRVLYSNFAFHSSYALACTLTICTCNACSKRH